MKTHNLGRGDSGGEEGGDMRSSEAPEMEGSQGEET